MTEQHDGKTTAHEAANGGAWGPNRWRIAAWAAAALVLLLPLVAMQVTDTVNWSAGDFILAGVLIGGTGLAFELALRKTTSMAYRAAAGLALAAAFALIWINGAVGIIGSEDEPANLLYGGVFAIGAIGAITARFQPRGMARALLAAAVAQVLVGVVALAGGWGATGQRWPLDVLGLTALFAALFAASALLFHKAAQQSPGVPAR